MRRFRFGLRSLMALPALSLVLFAGACGGAKDSGLFDEPSGSGGGDVTTDAGKGGTTTDAHVDGTDAAHDDSGSAHDASTHDDGGGTSEGGSDPDGSDGPKDLPCGEDGNGNSRTCSTAEGCCVTYPPLVGSPSFSCGAGAFGGCSPLVTCQSKDDCSNGEVCCGTLGFGTARYTTVQCQATCDTASSSNIRFCDPNENTDECSEINLKCTSSTVLTGYSRCN